MPAPAPDLQQLLQESVRLRGYTHARSTLATYAFDWAAFCAWCTLTERQPLPASTETVLVYLTDTMEQGRKVVTARRRAAAIGHYHRQAGLQFEGVDQVRALLAGAQRLKAERPRSKRALTIEMLRQICAQANERDISARDRSILTLGFASALRRSSLVALDLADLEFVSEGLVVEVRREKQDQLAKGRSIGIMPGEHQETCAVRSTAAWILERGTGPGPLYTPARGGPNRRMHPDMINQIVKKAVERIGIDPQAYGAHSLRAGMATAAFLNGWSDTAIMRLTGHRSADSLRRYIRLANIWKGNCTGGVGL